VRELALAWAFGEACLADARAGVEFTAREASCAPEKRKQAPVLHIVDRANLGPRKQRPYGLARRFSSNMVMSSSMNFGPAKDLSRSINLPEFAANAWHKRCSG
jgi:hypothetical protein